MKDATPDRTEQPKVTSGTDSWERDGAEREHAMLVGFLDEVAATETIQDAMLRAAAAMRIRTGDCVLDVGCGTGVFFPALAPAIGLAGRIVGLDHAAGFLRESRDRAILMGKSGQIDLVQGDAHRLPFPDDSFDAAHTERVLIHVAEPDLVLRELARVVRPGGWIVCVEPDLDGMRVDSDRPELVGAIVRGFCESIRNPAMGLELNRRMGEAGLVERTVESITEVERDYPEDVAEFFSRAAATAVAKGWITAPDAQMGLRAMQSAGDAGTYTSYSSMFIVAGRVP